MKQTGRSGAGVWLFRGGVLLGGIVGIGGSAQPEAFAQEANPTKAECARAYESSQESRAAGQLKDTIEKLAVCARPECPGFVQKDCARWLEEVEAELPSVLVQATGLDAEGAKAVQIAIDGKEVPGALGGAAVSLDPGRHELVATRPGRESITRVIVAQQGVHDRPVMLDFTEAPPPAPAPAAEPALDVSPDTSSGLRPYAYVAWGVGAVGLGAFAVFGTLGRADEQALKDDCPNATNDPMLVAPGICYKPDVDERKSSYETKFLFADIGLVTGIVGVATGTTLFILSATQSGGAAAAGDAEGRANATRWQVDVSPLAGGAFASVGRAF